MKLFLFEYKLIGYYISRFADSPILEGLSVHETKNEIIILLATVLSVHRIRLVHPNAMQV